MSEHFRVVVVGGGAVGNAVLYGLAKRGCTDTVLLEKGRLTSGSTWMAAGLLPSYARSRTVSKVINKSIEIYSGLEAETGQSPGLHLSGQMRIARTEGRLDEYRSYMDIAEAIDAEARLLTPEEVLEIWPLVTERETIKGALLHPKEGHISPTDVTMALARASRNMGAQIRENTPVEGFRRGANGLWHVTTADGGEISCEHIVLATGLHARRTAAKFGMDLPAFPLCVQYWITDTVPEVVERRRGNRPEFPIVRDELFDGYTREEGESFLFGFYETPEDVELFHPDGLAPDYENELLPPNLEGHIKFMEVAMEAIPALRRASIRSNTRGAMQMTPDGLPLAGPAWGVDNVWLAEGVPGGILWGGGIGHALSAWILDGAPPLDMNELDPRRFGPHATPAWAKEKVRETWGLHAKPHIPGEEYPAGRPARVPPAYDRLLGLGAVMGATAGWEIPLWYAPEGVEPVDDAAFRVTRHGRFVGEEVHAVRTGAGLADIGHMAKFEVSGPGAEAFLDRVLASRLPETGRCLPGFQLFPEGGVAAGYNVARLSRDLFYLTASAWAERLNFEHLRRALPVDGSVSLRNVTVERAILTVAGPRSRDVLAGIVETDLSNEAFEWRAARSVNAGFAPDVRVLRSSYAGELAYELHLPAAWQRTLLDGILDAGRAHGLRMVGERVFYSLRLDKGYRVSGLDLHREISPLRAGIGHVVDFGKDFVGRGALEKEQGNLDMRVVVLRVETDGASPIRHEGVHSGGKLVGRVTSGGWSWHFGTAFALALLPQAFCAVGTELEVSILGERCRATVVPDSPYDPEGLRMRQ